MNTPEPLTTKQQRLYDYLRLYSEENQGASPTVREIASHFGVSPTSTFELIRVLERKGWIKKKPFVQRSIVVLHSRSESLLHVCRGLSVHDVSRAVTDWRLKCLNDQERKENEVKYLPLSQDQADAMNRLYQEVLIRCDADEDLADQQIQEAIEKTPEARHELLSPDQIDLITQKATSHPGMVGNAA